jgi:hypothetical protein
MRHNDDEVHGLAHGSHAALCLLRATAPMLQSTIEETGNAGDRRASLEEMTPWLTALRFMRAIFHTKTRKGRSWLARVILHDRAHRPNAKSNAICAAGGKFTDDIEREIERQFCRTSRAGNAFSQLDVRRYKTNVDVPAPRCMHRISSVLHPRFDLALVADVFAERRTWRARQRYPFAEG